MIAHLRELEEMTRELIQIMVPDAGEFDIAYAYVLPPETTAALQRMADARRRAQAATKEAAIEHAAAAASLQAAGLPLRDIGQVLGISYQRAHQLVHVGEVGID